MTSTTGRLTAATARQTPDRGFTLIEMMIVMSILVILMSMVVVVLRGVPDRARGKGTIGLIAQLEQSLQAYYTEFHKYPPDGYDFPVTAPNGTQLKGTATLTYFLAWKYHEGSELLDIPGGMKKKSYVDSNRGIEQDVNRGRPFLDVKGIDFSPDGEILDKWGHPLHYDNVEYDKEARARYSPEADSEHMPSAEAHSDPSPRDGDPIYPGSFDLWSHGTDGHTPDATADDDITREKK